MSEPASILDGLVFRPNSVEALSDWEVRHNPCIAVDLLGHSRERGLKLPVPFFSRQSVVRPHQPGWSEYCKLLRRIGIPIYATVAAFESLPAASIPSRFGIRYSDYPLDELEITTADAFEIVCRRGAAGGIADSPNSDSMELAATWPLEIGSRFQLAGLVTLMTDISGGDMPIGLGLPIGTASSDIEAAIDSGFDYITFEAFDWPIAMGSAQLDLVACSIASARSVTQSLGKNTFPLLLDFPVDTGDHLIRLLALGASAVTVDGIVARAVADQAQASLGSVGKGMLSSIAEPSAMLPMSFSELESTLQSMLARLKHLLALCGCESLESFDRTRLASIDARAAQLTGVSMLGS